MCENCKCNRKKLKNVKLVIEGEDIEQVQYAMESIVLLIADGYNGGTTQNGCYWNIEE